MTVNGKTRGRPRLTPTVKMLGAEKRALVQENRELIEGVQQMTAKVEMLGAVKSVTYKRRRQGRWKTGKDG